MSLLKKLTTIANQTCRTADGRAENEVGRIEESTAREMLERRHASPAPKP